VHPSLLLSAEISLPPYEGDFAPFLFILTPAKTEAYQVYKKLIAATEVDGMLGAVSGNFSEIRGGTTQGGFSDAGKRSRGFIGFAIRVLVDTVCGG
jgi:hypothetical protein